MLIDIIKHQWPNPLALVQVGLSCLYCFFFIACVYECCSFDTELGISKALLCSFRKYSFVHTVEYNILYITTLSHFTTSIEDEKLFISSAFQYE